MRRGIGVLSIVSMLHRLRTSRWLAWFAIGVMLGASMLLVKISLNELRQVQARPHAESAPLLKDNGRREGDPAIRESSVIQQPTKPAAGTDRRNERPTVVDQLLIHVYLTKERRIESIPLETYVRGVIAAEMPITFELEALKAQAIAASTYIIRRIVQGNQDGVPVQEADVTDTTDHQVYLSVSDLAAKWGGDDQKSNMNKLDQAIAQTRGKIVTYKGQPIEALFFSTSNGYTENSEDYWQQEIPYLRSVESPWDESISPKYKETIKLSLNEFYRRLGVTGKNTGKSSIRVVEKTEGNRISKIVIAGTTLTGREVREKLKLASSEFTWSMKGNEIAITTYGYGHGVGMSQWGANGMAQAGASAEKILAHYYSSVQVEQASKLSKQLASRL